MIKLSILLTTGLVVAACGVVDPATESTTSTRVTTTSTPSLEETTTSTASATTTMPTDSTEVTPADLAVADLAGRLDVEPNTIEVVTVEEVTWSDSSLGCQHPDRLYAQVLTDGVRIVLSHDGDEFHYHADMESDPFLCADPDDRGFVSPLKEEPEISVPPPID